MKCGDCKHWDRDSKEYAPRRPCERMDNLNNLIRVVAWNWDTVITAPDFGCVQFEKRETP